MSGPRPAGTVGRRSAWAVLAILTVLSLLVPPTAAMAAPTALPTAVDGDDGTGLTVEIVDLAPAILVPDADLRVTVTVTNPTDRAAESPEVRLRLQRSTPISRSALERWLDPDYLAGTTLLAVETLPEPLAPGASTTLTVPVAAADLPLSTSSVSWGPRGIEASVADAAEPAATPAQDRTYVLWWPGLDVTPTPVSVLAPLVPTAAERTAAAADATSLADAAAPRLGPLLAALGDADVAVDPALLAADPAREKTTPDDDATPTPEATATGTEEPTDPVTEPATSATTAAAPARSGPAGDELLTAVADHPRLHALPWGDADVAALAHTGAGDLLDRTLEAAGEALDAAGVTASTGLAWPAADEPDSQTVAAVRAAGADAVVLPSASVEVTRSITYTPTGRATVSAGGGTLPAVLADERLSRILVGRHQPITPGEDDGEETVLDDLTARQFLLAETAVIARERPSDPRGLLLTLPRGTDVDASALADRLQALGGAPWVDVVPLARLLDTQPPDLERAPLPEQVVEEGELDAATLAACDSVLELAAAFAGITAEPEEIVAPVRTAVLGVLSAAWRAAPDAREALVEGIAGGVADLTALVAARPGSTLNLLNEEAHIPVAVTNDLDQPVRVRVRLEPRDPRLVAEETAALDVDANSSATAQVPVHAVGSGDVVVDVLLTSPAGEPIGPETEIRVRVRADWENIGTGVLVGVLALMLVVGIVRTVRRNRGRRRVGANGEGAS